MNPDRSKRRLLLSMLAITLLFGAFEGFFGRTDYGGDGISYLNVVRSIYAGDWRAVFSPYWGLGYPLMLSAWLPLFPKNPAWEWMAIHSLNLLILALTFFSFYRLVRIAFSVMQAPHETPGGRAERFLLIAALPIFLSTEVSIDSVSRVSPDMLIACLVFAAVSSLLEMKRQARAGNAVVLGLLLGIGYLVKGIFLPLSLAFIAIECILLWRKEAVKLVPLTLVSMAVFAIPYAAGLTWAYGRPTLGEVGSINYAWYVNGLQMDVFWQGGPPEFGKPLHPPTQVSSNPSIYLFDGPHAVTYAPWFNPPYYYQGYRRFFSLKRLMKEVVADLRALAGIVARRLVLYALLLGIILRWCGAPNRARFLSGFARLWPLPAAALAGLTIYVLVYLQPRHISSFVAMVLLALCLAMVGSKDDSLDRALRAPLRIGLLALLFAAWFATIAIQFRGDDESPFAHMANHQLFYNSDQWKASQYLASIGLHPGDKVAWVADYWEITRCTWAYIGHLKIIGEVGGELLDPQRDELSYFWRSTPEQRKQMLELFRHAGARLVLALRMPSYADTTGWERVPDTNLWIYRF